MPLTTTRRTPLVDQVIEQMRTAIADGDWAVDQRIPPEPELVTALGVGRNTVREAVRALAHAGLLEVRQGDGTFVRATSEISGAVRRLCGTELREVLQTRRALEVEAARLAAENRTEADLADLRAALAERDALFTAGDLPAAIESDARFHALVVRCSHNALLTELYTGVLEAVRASVAVTTSPQDPLLDHARLVAAITAANPETAAHEATLLITHLLTTKAEP